jgi:hypothetical protein
MSWLDQPPTTIEALERLTEARLQCWREAHLARDRLQSVEARLLEVRSELEKVALCGSNQYV